MIWRLAALGLGVVLGLALLLEVYGGIAAWWYY